MPRKETSPRSDDVQSVVLALQVLEYLARQDEAVGVTALAQALKTTKSRIHRHLRTLLGQGYVVQAEGSEKYRVGARLVALGRMAGDNLDLASAARDIIRELRDALGHSVVVSQLESDGVRVLAKMAGTSMIEIGVKPGSLLGFHCTAQGKLALAFGPEALRLRILGSRLEMLTPRTIVSANALRREIDRVRRQGWAVAANESLIGINALAAPVFDAAGAFAGAVAIVDSVQFIEERPSEERIRQTVAAAERVSHALGHVAGTDPLAPVAAVARLS